MTNPQTEHSCRCDGDLLRRYVECRDDQALAELISRHATVVRGVCRRLLGDTPDADDAFQATFLVLIRQGDHILRPQSLAAWLYGVAHRIAKRQLRHQSRIVRPLQTEVTATGDDLLTRMALRHDVSLLDAELAKLPEKYRAPIVLHHLEGKSHREVAAEMQLTEGAVDGLLKRGRNELRVRLARRGVVFGVTMAALQSTQESLTAASSQAVVDATVQGLLTLDPVLHPEFPKLPASRLAQQELSMMLLSQSTKVAAWTLVASLFLGAAGVGISTARHEVARNAAGFLGSELGTDHPGPAAAIAANDEVESESEDDDSDQQKPRADGVAPPSVQGLILDVDQNQKVVRLSLGSDDQLKSGMKFLIFTGEGNAKKLKATIEITRVEPDRSEARILDEVENLPVVRGDKFSAAPAAIAEFATQAPAELQEGKLSDHPILKKLDEPTEISFVDTSLRDALDYWSKLHGFNISLDEAQIKDDGVSLDHSVDLELSGVTLRLGLKLLLDAISLDYIIEDDVMKITSQKAAENFREMRMYELNEAWKEKESAERLEALVKDTAGGKWQSPGTPGAGGTVQWTPQGLAVRHNQRTLLAVEKLLARLEKEAGNASQQPRPTDLASTSAGEPMSFRRASVKEREIFKALSERTEVSFVDTSLRDVLSYIKQLHKFDILINEPEIVADGGSVDQQISLELSGVALESALNRILEPLELDYVVKDEILMITTTNKASDWHELRVYPRNLLTSAWGEVTLINEAAEEKILKSIKEAVGGIWETTSVEVGGFHGPATVKKEGGTMSLTPAGLVVRQNQRVHREIENLLEQLRRANGDE